MRSWATRVSGIGAVVLSSSLACSGSAPRYEDLPRVIVPLEASQPPEPDEEAPPPTAETVRLVGNTDAPDPPAARTREQIEYHLGFERGVLKLLGQEEKLEEQARLTPRRVGRFAVELFLGPELVERVRFDFPLLGGEPSEASLEKGLTTEAHVLVPLVRRATRARVLDRKTRQELELPWPPAATSSPP